MRKAIAIYALLIGVIGFLSLAFLPYILEYAISESTKDFGVPQETVSHAVFTQIKVFWPVYFIGFYLSVISLYAGYALLIFKEHAETIWLILSITILILSVIHYFHYERDFGYIHIIWNILVVIISVNIFNKSRLQYAANQA